MCVNYIRIFLVRKKYYKLSLIIDKQNMLKTISLKLLEICALGIFI